MTKYCKHPKSMQCHYDHAFNHGVPEEHLVKVVEEVFKKNTRGYGDPCCDCGGLNEPYMVTNRAWNQEAKMSEGFLCLDCIQNRIKRKLTIDDFTEAPINWGIFGFDARTWLGLQ